MNEKLPYEQQLQQQWTDIPLPDENLAWDDMARRLEEDDDKPVVFWWRPGCGLLGLLLLVMIGLGWWFLRPDKQVIDKDQDTGKQVVTANEQQKSGGNEQSIQSPEKKNNNPEEINSSKEDSTHKGGATTTVDQPLIDSMQQPKKTTNNEVTNKQTSQLTISEENNHQRSSNKQASPKSIVGKEKKPAPTPAITTKGGNRKGRGEVSGPNSLTPQASGTTGRTITGQDSSTTAKTSDTASRVDTVATPPVKKDSVKTARPPSTAKKEPPAADSSKKNKLFFSAGLSLQQQIPLAGQKPTPYTSSGRKGSLADYIPSVYMRLNKKDKWFLQAEFRYGAPQYSKEFTYHQASIPDTGSNPQFVTNSSARLKKTFYHQLPITFNYFVKPNWSVGGGVIWNKFYAALSDQETIKHDLNTQTDEVVFKGLVSVKDDTSGTFASSYLQAVIESQYKWKRFSFGARYAFGLQPYIRFTLPGQGTREEKNSNLQLFLRFELIRPKKD